MRLDTFTGIAEQVPQGSRRSLRFVSSYLFQKKRYEYQESNEGKIKVSPSDTTFSFNNFFFNYKLKSAAATYCFMSKEVFPNSFSAS